MSRPGYFFKEALRGCYEAKLMTMVSILTVAAALFLLAAAAVGAATVHQSVTRISRMPDIVVYVTDATAGDASALSSLRASLAGLSQIDSVAYLDKNEARSRFLAMYGIRLLDGIEGNPLPASFELTLKRGFKTESGTAGVVALLRGGNGIESVDYSPQWLARLTRIRNWLLFGVGALGCAGILVLHFIVSNTIKLTIYARRDLVITMRYVGATDAYIQTPFILEGIIQGVAGAFLAIAVLSVCRAAATPLPLEWGPSGLIPFSMVGAGVLFGWSGSASALHKFLR